MYMRRSIVWLPSSGVSECVRVVRAEDVTIAKDYSRTSIDAARGRVMCQSH